MELNIEISRNELRIKPTVKLIYSNATLPITTFLKMNYFCHIQTVQYYHTILPIICMKSKGNLEM